MPRGGKRQGAGRPKGSGQYQEKTIPLRIPESMVSEIRAYVAHKGYRLPLFSSKVQAGFPSPADDYVEGKLDLNEHLIRHPAATFFLRVAGESMRDIGIFPNDILIVDRSLKPIHGKIVIAVVGNELTVKRLHIKGNTISLLAENPDYPPIDCGEGTDLQIWGVVTNVIHSL